MSHNDGAIQLAKEIAELVASRTTDRESAISVLVGSLAYASVGAARSPAEAAEILTRAGRVIVDLAVKQFALATAASGSRASA